MKGVTRKSGGKVYKAIHRSEVDVSRYKTAEIYLGDDWRTTLFPHLIDDRAVGFSSLSYVWSTLHGDPDRLFAAGPFQRYPEI